MIQLIRKILAHIVVLPENPYKTHTKEKRVCICKSVNSSSVKSKLEEDSVVKQTDSFHGLGEKVETTKLKVEWTVAVVLHVNIILQRHNYR